MAAGLPASAFFTSSSRRAIARRLIDAAGAETGELLKQLGATSEGLTIKTAAQRLSTLGPNAVAHERQQNLVEEFDAWTNPPLFQTGWFVESLLTQTLIIHIIRTAKIPFLQSRASNSLIVATILVAGAGALLPYSLWLRRSALFPCRARTGRTRNHSRILRAGASGQDLVRAALGNVKARRHRQVSI
jgi:hypothetical protein